MLNLWIALLWALCNMLWRTFLEILILPSIFLKRFLCLSLIYIFLFPLLYLFPLSVVSCHQVSPMTSTKCCRHTSGVRSQFYKWKQKGSDAEPYHFGYILYNLSYSYRDASIEQLQCWPLGLKYFPNCYFTKACRLYCEPSSFANVQLNFYSMQNI